MCLHALLKCEKVIFVVILNLSIDSFKVYKMFNKTLLHAMLKFQV